MILHTLRSNLKPLFYKCFWLFPVHNDRIFFQSFERASGFNDNPKYLCEYLINNYPSEFELIFACNKDVRELREDIKRVNFRSLQWFYYLATSKVVVINVRTPYYLSRRKGQLVINTWHAGGAYKRTGVYKDESNRKYWEYVEKKRREFINLFISSSQKFTESNIIESMKYDGEILQCGMPRNDMFFDPAVVKRNSEKVREIIGKKDAVYLLYAPTFRGLVDRSNKLQYIPPLSMLAQTLEEKLGKEVVVLVRKHHHDVNQYDVADSVYDVSAYPDMQELLCCADILITDYSSSMWDFSLMGKPCFLYVPDLEEYVNNDRGFFTPIEKWPGIICKNDEQLIEELRNLDFSKSADIAKSHLAYMVSYENGNASQTIAEYIVNYTNRIK